MAFINFDKFWNYYDATTRTDYSRYRREFHDAIFDALVDMDMIDACYPGA